VDIRKLDPTQLPSSFFTSINTISSSLYASTSPHLSRVT
jgi:hypothetical protein